MKTTVLIMAGGQGERFWPKSRTKLPKQFLNITNSDKTMIQLTVERVKPIVSIEDIYIITNENYKDLVKEQIPDLPNENIICEPVGRNTAPCIGLAAMYMTKKYDDSVMIVLPADHLIKNVDEFVDTLLLAKDKAISGKNLVTIGIRPNYPETGFGYIKYIDNENDNFYSVDKFVEKPILEKAKQYLNSGNYLWNSGMFIWKTSTIIENIQKFLPDTYDKLLEIKKAIGTKREEEVLKEIFPTIEKESIDYGIMEKTDNIYTLPGSFGWDDVGSWNCLDRINQTDEENNIKFGNVVSVNTSNCIIYGNKRLITTLNVKDLVIVDTEDAVLIADKNSTGDIKEVIAKVKANNKEEYI